MRLLLHFKLERHFIQIPSRTCDTATHYNRILNSYYSYFEYCIQKILIQFCSTIIIWEYRYANSCPIFEGSLTLFPSLQKGYAAWRPFLEGFGCMAPNSVRHTKPPQQKWKQLNIWWVSKWEREALNNSKLFKHLLWGRLKMPTSRAEFSLHQMKAST